VVVFGGRRDVFISKLLQPSKYRNRLKNRLKMMQIESTEITTSKTKLGGLILVSIAFITIGLWILIVPRTDSVFPIFNNRLIAAIFGTLDVIFFGLFLFVFILQLFGYRLKQGGLKIDINGITDNSKSSAFGFIPWDDFRDVTITKVFNRKILTIIVHNPQKYIDRQGTIVKRKAMETDYKLTGSPINISTGFLNTNVEKLKSVIEERFNEYKNSK
jgi:hypothetical protein